MNRYNAFKIDTTRDVRLTGPAHVGEKVVIEGDDPASALAAAGITAPAVVAGQTVSVCKGMASAFIVFNARRGGKEEPGAFKGVVFNSGLGARTTYWLRNWLIPEVGAVARHFPFVDEVKLGYK